MTDGRFVTDPRVSERVYVSGVNVKYSLLSYRYSVSRREYDGKPSARLLKTNKIYIQSSPGTRIETTETIIFLKKNPILFSFFHEKILSIRCRNTPEITL